MARKRRSGVGLKSPGGRAGRDRGGARQLRGPRAVLARRRSRETASLGVGRPYAEVSSRLWIDTMPPAAMAPRRPGRLPRRARHRPLGRDRDRRRLHRLRQRRAGGDRVTDRTTRKLAHRLAGPALSSPRLRAEPRLIFLRRRTASELEHGPKPRAGQRDGDVRRRCRSRRRGSFDLPGTVMMTASVSLFVVALVHGPDLEGPRELVKPEWLLAAPSSAARYRASWLHVAQQSTMLIAPQHRGSATPPR
jgi:hypothetical protein